MEASEIITYRAGIGTLTGALDADPITTEVIRHGLNSAAEQIKRTVIRTAMSPIIYEVLDFAPVLYDRQTRLLAQAPSLNFFMGTMSFCIESAVEAVGGEDALEAGDIILMNDPFRTGSHQQDVAVVMPVFLSDDQLIGYSAIKAHWMDIGAKELYCTDTTDVFQEGTIFPGVKLYARGQRVEDVWRMALANSRLPRSVGGDINAEVAAVRSGADALVRLVERYGLTVFEQSIERMFDHGEAVVRSYFERIPDGHYTGHGQMDNDGVSDDVVPFEISIDVEGSSVRIDFANAPDALPGPINCPIPSTVSAARVAVMMLAGGGEAPNEGHFRPIEIVARRGSMFNPESPAPCFLYAWPVIQAIEVVFDAIAKAAPEAAPACSGGDIVALLWWGVREDTGEFWGDGSPYPVGQGAHASGDGTHSLLHISEASTRFPPTEVWEARTPCLLEKVELAPDSCGAGKHRGGLGADFFFRFLEDAYVTSTVERTRSAPWGLAGGLPARPNSAALRYPDGTRQPIAKVTALRVPKGATFELCCGGGGGFGLPSDRDPEAALDDLREGYTTQEYVERHYPHVLARSSPDA